VKTYPLFFFSLFLNDLKAFLANQVDGSRLVTQLAHDLDFTDVAQYVHLFLLLYADDTAILAENAEDMQRALNALNDYCIMNGLKINVDKTKVMIFSRGKVRNLPELYFNNEKVQIVWEYKYLGTVFNYNNKFQKAIKMQCSSANRAIFSLLKKIRKHDLPLDLQLELFDKCVKPILLYGSEIWGFENLQLCDKMQLKFYKILLNVRKSTPSCMVLGEIGQLPVSIDAKCRLLCFWFKLCLNYFEGSNKVSVLMLRLCQSAFDNSDYKLPWLETVRTLLNNLGLSYIWINPQNYLPSIDNFKKLVKQKLHDQFIQEWKEKVDTCNICTTYRLFKTSFCLEEYLLCLPMQLRRTFLKFRIGNNKLPVNKLRFANIARIERVCIICPLQDIGDEFHYIFKCTHPDIVTQRSHYLTNYMRHHTNVIKFSQLMNTKSKKKLNDLCRFISGILTLFN
jgi:hypothetical protein